MMSEHAPGPNAAKPAVGSHAKAMEPSGSEGNDPSTAGPGSTNVVSSTPENEKGHLNPSAPEDANTTPQSTTDK